MPPKAYPGRPLFFVAHGDDISGRPPLVLVHGAGGTLWHWPPQVRRLPGARVLALDLPGHGQSPPAAPDALAATTVNALAASVLALLDYLRLEQAIIVGHSMGAAIALTLALTEPRRVAGLGLVGAGARLRVAPDLIEGLSQDFAGTVAEIVRRTYGPDAPENLTRLAKKRLLETDPKVLRADWAACDTFDVMERLGEIDLPSLVVTGTADQMTPEKYGRYLADHLPRAQLRLIAGAGHMVMLEQPAAVAQALQEWLAETAL